MVKAPRRAVVDLDLVVTSGPILKHPEPTIPAGWLSPGAFACALDFDSYWRGEALSEADRLVTDDVGQMKYYRSIGYFKSTPEPQADLGEIVAGRKPGRRSERERAICINLGLAVEDVATAHMIYERARSQGIGTELEL